MYQKIVLGETFFFYNLKHHLGKQEIVCSDLKSASGDLKSIAGDVKRVSGDSKGVHGSRTKSSRI